MSSGSDGSGKGNGTQGEDETPAKESESVHEEEPMEKVVEEKDGNGSDGDIEMEPEKTCEADPAEEPMKSEEQSTVPQSLESLKATENPSTLDKSFKSLTDNERETQEESHSATPPSVPRAPLSKRPSQDPDPVWVLNLLKKLEKQFMSHYIEAMTEFKVRWDLDDSLILDTMISELKDEVGQRIQNSIQQEIKKIQGRAGKGGRSPRPPGLANISRDSTMTERRRRMLKVMKNQSVKTADSVSDEEMTGSDQRSDDDYCPCEACVRKKMAARPFKKNPLAAEAPVMMEFDLRKILQLKKNPSPATVTASEPTEVEDERTAADEEGRNLEVVEEEEEEEDEEEDAGSRKDEQDEEEDDVSERSLQSLESRGEQTPLGGEESSPPSTSTYHRQFGPHTESTQSQSPDFIRGKQESLESRALKDFSIESLLQEGLYPRMSTLDRRANFSPLIPSFYPSMWASEFPAFPQQLLTTTHPHGAAASPQTRLAHAFPASAPLEPSRPLDLAVKREIIKEETKEEVPPSLLQDDFLKEFVSSGLGSTMNAGSAASEGHSLAPIKDEADIRSYLSFLSSASHLSALFPPWQLAEERKMKPKASQQCPICNKVIQGAGKLPRHMRTHTGEKPYMCTICEVRFTRQDKLKIHMRKHTGERPYICLHCNSKFVHNYDLKNHLRIHTGVRPYQCEHCYKSFTRSDHLHRHIKRQSCRISRPRRGRKPAAWRSAPAGNFLCPPAVGASRLEESRLSPAYQGVKGHGLGELLGLGGRSLGFKSVDASGREGRGERQVEEETAGAGRQRGVFAFALAGEEVLSHSPFYAATSDPWTMRLERAPPIPESAK
uniref:Zinc finger and BTB domain containing 7C n=2 Tax=Iconisemion striatum TaxID=60296 RepID=A0A1A7XBF8_9TELE